LRDLSVGRAGHARIAPSRARHAGSRGVAVHIEGQGG